ncbi:MAG: hypothetical protein IT181_16025 [Acidobacteria bacterium]|nr:hypothetical protein [Acidobacteriota bacterium]
MEGSVRNAGWLVMLFVAASALSGCVEGAAPVLQARPAGARHVAGNLMAQPGSVGNADGITTERPARVAGPADRVVLLAP